jgi:RNA polymerase sigma-70 factor (ECF subfamily)
MDDNQLIALILEGDEKAKDLMVELYEHKLIITATHFLGYQDAEIEDTVQETFMLALKALPQFKHQSALYTWLNRICVNACFLRLKKRQRRNEELSEDLELLSTDLARQRFHDQDSESSKEHQLELLTQQLGRMGEPCQSLLRGHHLEGKSCIALSKQFKVPMGTIMCRLSRCRSLLKQIFLEALSEEKP